MKQSVENPDNIETSWNIRSTDNMMRALLVQRCDINHYYTVLNKRVEVDDDTYTWVKVPNSTRSHGNDKQAALARIQHLIDMYNTFI